jgi:hypothetical protein
MHTTSALSPGGCSRTAPPLRATAGRRAGPAPPAPHALTAKPRSVSAAVARRSAVQPAAATAEIASGPSCDLEVDAVLAKELAENGEGSATKKREKRGSATKKKNAGWRPLTAPAHLLGPRVRLPVSPRHPPGGWALGGLGLGPRPEAEECMEGGRHKGGAGARPTAPAGGRKDNAGLSPLGARPRPPPPPPRPSSSCAPHPRPTHTHTPSPSPHPPTPLQASAPPGAPRSFAPSAPPPPTPPPWATWPRPA